MSRSYVVALDSHVGGSFEVTLQSVVRILSHDEAAYDECHCHETHNLHSNLQTNGSFFTWNGCLHYQWPLDESLRSSFHVILSC